jgi:hypothetical protein
MPVSLCCSFLIVPFVYSSVYFFLCLVYPMWHCQHRKHNTQDKINTRVNRRDNKEWTAQRHCQHRIHNTQDKMNTRVNRRDSVYSSVYFVLCLVYPKMPVSLCCSFLIVPFVYSSFYFVLSLAYPMLSVSLCCSFVIVPSVYSRMNNTETLSTSYTQHTGQNEH